MVEIEKTDSREDVLVGPVREARNWKDISIHDADTAKDFGFRGAIVAGSVHLNMWPAVLQQAFGDAWFERGCVSLYFLNTVVHGERVQVVSEKPHSSLAQVRTWARFVSEPGKLVASGTACIGDPRRSELRTRDLRLSAPSELRILRGLEPGCVLQDEPFYAGAGRQLDLIERDLIPAPLPCYTDPARWGGLVACPYVLVSYVHDHERHYVFEPWVKDTPGMYGAIELDFVNGPLILDREYRVFSEVVGVGQSPKTEYCLWDSRVTDDAGETVVTMRHLQRYLKAPVGGSPKES